MMLESSYLYWNVRDSDLLQDFISLGEDECVLDCEDYGSNIESESTRLSSCSTTPNHMSTCSSDYEGLALDDLDNILPISDNFVSQILEDNNVIGFSDFDWWSLTDNPKKCQPSGTDKNTDINVTKRKTKSLEYLSSSKLWSKMSSEEQLQTLHALSEIVTCHMDIREQIEVIKIIDPSAVISPDDKEFALDSSFLNDVKLKKIRDFIKKQKRPLLNSLQSIESSSSNLGSPRKASTTKLLPTKSNSSNLSRTKKKQKKQKITFSDEDKRLQRKRRRQGKKEEQSGLFVYEKMIKKLNNPSEEDEDVNILE
ncbi:protein FAM199X-B-like isoform X1 [Stegodyphus dumicola]|uniref:protein FAM199X-B-like isoform X1 n=2 Tax=Stegodyphus dumicola TaxID=202533 RepID=UPI0015B0DED3|nr:protein FAM199X-B-like isoform X1 [Stegodyphus dumicola]